jgi:hypothetical protein
MYVSFILAMCKIDFQFKTRIGKNFNNWDENFLRYIGCFHCNHNLYNTIYFCTVHQIAVDISDIVSFINENVHK